MLLTVLLVDLACAYPAPDQINSKEMLKDYEPGIRFIRLLIAFQLLAGTNTINDFVVAMNESNFELAEHFLLQVCEYPYPRAVDIYKSWRTYYQDYIASGDSVFAFRKNCITQRSNEFSSYVIKRPSQTIEKTHLYWITTRGLESLGSSPEYLDPATQKEFVIDFLKQMRDWELVSYFFVSGSYRCPLAASQVFCDAVTQACTSGIRSFGQFPPNPGCSVRKGLEEAEFHL
jgi:hypothetical protein